jgi:oligopeptidase A
MQTVFPEFTVTDENLDNQKELVLKQIEENKNKIEELLKIKNKSYNNFIKPYQLINVKLGLLVTPISHLNYVKNSPKTQEVYTQIIPVLTEYYTQLGQDERIYKAFKEIYQKEKNILNQEQKKVLEDAIRDFELSGVGLSQEKEKKLRT